LRFYPFWKTAKMSLRLEAVKRNESADQYTAGFVVRQAGDAEAIVHSVDEVDVLLQAVRRELHWRWFAR
jgi:hypothetical protein